ncbi:uncharacterized protein A1O9_10594 [Exophiala aquamarina CBS 119918]|uniref:Uncharacterized protein n=1 Tax=Exophiala aquamarina CBS 119918 TaxID=1182545 RepID=A0A072P0F5_9EURO|nr:uncharacterized protein A1O9_10594 [Exophiala aquamarina CBS 119918]KEF53619.1 hypothetical protein A1O9_10594 [Exophiala aquamarina CBS 119918]
MYFNYLPLPRCDKEEYKTPIDPTAALDDEDNLSITSRKTIQIYTSQWLWLLHAILLASSLTLFTLSVMVRSSTLQHVQEFSAWSPAAPAVRYQPVKYDVSTSNNQFVGAGPEVDKAWRGISYDMGDQ